MSGIVHPGLLLLGVQLYHKGFKDIPIITKSCLVLNVVVYLISPIDLSQAWLSFHDVYTNNEWHRLLLASLHHVNSLHLWGNMAFFLGEGSCLERRMGRGWFLYLLCVFSLLSDLMYLLLQVLLDQLQTQPQFAYLLQPLFAHLPTLYDGVLGFSGVLFGLSVLKYHYDPDGVTIVWVAPVPNRYVVWAKLVLFSVILGSSLFGHLAGILVGLLYTKGPLETIMKLCAGLAFSVGIYARRLYDLITGTRHWAGEEVRHEELRDNRLRRLQQVPK